MSRNQGLQLTEAGTWWPKIARLAHGPWQGVEWQCPAGRALSNLFLVRADENPAHEFIFPQFSIAGKGHAQTPSRFGGTGTACGGEIGGIHRQTRPGRPFIKCCSTQGPVIDPTTQCFEHFYRPRVSGCRKNWRRWRNACPSRGPSRDTWYGRKSKVRNGKWTNGLSEFVQGV